MADLNDIAVFVRVAQFESFSRAARALGMPVSTVSRRVTALEERIGATLLQRTTRKLSLTAQGRAYYNQCSEPLSHLFDAERVLTETQKKPEGLLRVSAPVILGQEPFYAFLSSFLKTYPSIQVDLFVTNLFLDLIVENIDVAIRFGELPDSSLIAQRIGKSVRYVVAAPDYLRGRLPPSRPEDLRQHQCVLLHARNNEFGMASHQRQEIHQAPCLGAGGGAGFRRGERIHLSRSRHWPLAIDLLRRSDREWRTRPASSRLVVARDLSACSLSDAPISAGEAAGIPRAPEGLEEPPLDSVAMTSAGA